MNGYNDLARLIGGGPSQDTSPFGQGELIAWNPATFENVIDFRGGTLHNVAILPGVDALSLATGDQVILARISGTAISSWGVIGRFDIPPTDKPARIQGGDLIVEGGGSVIVGDGGDVRVEEGGSVEVNDDSGETQVRMGSLESTGGFGLEQLVGSTMIPLAALAGGALVDVVAAEESLNEPASGNSGFVDLDTTGPSVTFTTYTGKWLVLLIASGSIPGDQAAARMSYTATGAQSVSASNARSSLLGLNVAGVSIGFGNHVFVNVHNGAPGTITCTSKYRLIASASFPAAASWSNRGMIVIPY